MAWNERWLATRGGLNRFDPQTEQSTVYHPNPGDSSGLLHDSLWSVHLDSEGMLWVGTSLGRNKLDPRSGQFLIAYRHDPDDSYSLSGTTVTVIHEDQAGMLWFGTLGGGLNRFDRETEHFTRYKHDPANSQSLGDNTGWTIHEDREGMLWIGTSAGVARFEPEEERFARYGEENGLPRGGVMSFLDDSSPKGGALANQDGPNLWLGTSSGLYKFNPRTESLRRFDVGDGLQGNIFKWRSRPRRWPAQGSNDAIDQLWDCTRGWGRHTGTPRGR